MADIAGAIRPGPVMRARLHAIGRLLAPRAGAIGHLVVLGVIASFAEGATVTLVAGAIGAFLGGVPPAVLPALVRNGPGLVLVVAGLLLGRMAASTAYRLSSELLASALADDVRVAIFARFTGAPFTDALRRGTAAMLNTLEWESYAVPEAAGALTTVAMDAIAVVVYAALLLLVSWRTLLLAIVLGALVLPVSAANTPRLRRLSDQLRTAYVDLAGVTVAMLEGLRSVRLFGAEGQAASAQRAASGALAGASRRIARRNALVGAGRSVLGLLLGAIFLFALFHLPVRHGAAIAAVALLYRILPHLRSIETSTTQLLGETGRLFGAIDALALPVAVLSGDGLAKPTPIPFERVAFTGIRFRYATEGEPALDGVDLVLDRGSYTAVTGPSGSGKTTLVNLLARLVVPTDGDITVDGRSLGSLPLADWLATVSFAGQDLELIGGSIDANLRLGRPGLDDATIAEALELAQAAAFVRALPNGLATEVGDRGTLLSGGQRQRLVLARALARRPLLLVLDEATNAVDPAMERDIFAALRSARPELTLLSITHRGDTGGADQVIALDGGRVVRAERPKERAGSEQWRASA